MYPFTSRGDPHHHHQQQQQQQNLSMNNNSLGFSVSAAVSASSSSAAAAAVSFSTIPTCFLPLNYSSSSCSSLRECTPIDPLRAAAAPQSYRSSWPRDHEEHNHNIPVNTNNNTKGLTSPEREVHHHLSGSSNSNNNSTSGSMLNCGNTSLSMGAVRMKKVRRKVREPRFCFKTLSDVDVLDDGYKWRKYGQKVVKNTQHPRSYYRCTQDNCRVKKRIERLAEDPRMVITTYEGRHAHSPSHDDEEPQSSSQMNFLW